MTIRDFKTLSTNRCFDGVQGVYSHASTETRTTMRFSVFTPPQAAHGPVPVVWFLSGLTCTEENFTVKAGAQRVAAELGLMLVAPDTSPRGVDDGGETVPDDPDGAWDFGLGAGFYVDATEAPWARNYRMFSYVATELPQLIEAEFPADMAAQGIMGHSMGGHGALTLALRHPGRFRSASAFAPITSPLNCPWGEKALGGYLGPDRSLWRAHDTTALIADGARCPHILVDQGLADGFLGGQLKPQLLEEVCMATGQPLTLNRREGYDHSYYFIASFMEDHLRWHAGALKD
ncbi:S-formylglutathione hydrolase [Tistrella bauzanensis]|uniref:S-formylglutathione hydrolase n=1 Tax=Tistrella bauzanensis TaxID=657419 RepID=A0ABQ1JDB4_9PROT|nr:S-formylglutathione hydrolase [Tistrella bauzanensis]GGB63623.1 S-formylglutathione hydrolase [Tistrella bauzanensis]